eukprot:2911653-Rhodomonas_salina.1
MAIQHEVAGRVRAFVRAWGRRLHAGHRKGVHRVQVSGLPTSMDGTGARGRHQLRTARVRQRRLLARVFQVHDGIQMARA